MQMRVICINKNISIFRERHHPRKTDSDQGGLRSPPKAEQGTAGDSPELTPALRLLLRVRRLQQVDAREEQGHQHGRN